LIIWDVKTLKVVQSFSHALFDLTNDELTVCYLNPGEQRLILGNRKLLALSHTNQSNRHQQRTSHRHAVTRVLFNFLFDLIISADEGSSIHVWNMKTTEKVMHILNAHPTELNKQASEISAMSFDETQRRLITGAHDGSLALWNFNNGVNLYRLPSEVQTRKEITALVHWNERLFVAGWSRTIRVFHLAKSPHIRPRESFDVETHLDSHP
jgi:WD40 repeat protein